MKWIARVVVFTTALVFGTFVASLFGHDTTPAIVPVKAPNATAPVTTESLLGTWKGTWDHNKANCTIEIRRVEGDTFHGVLKESGAEVLFEGTFDPKTRMLDLNETEVIRVGAYDEWSLGKNSGVLSPDGHILVGIGHDKWGQYSWSATNY
jgi:hypothetical protein